MDQTPEFDKRILVEEKERLSYLPYFDRAPEDDQYGVLLSDRIEHYCGQNFKLIDPFSQKCLRPAGYDLRVGFNYAIGGKRRCVSLGEKVIIEPYQVAVIQTMETLNIPHFLIGRWNIRVGLAYKGLLWVGGAQVDPGFRGRLSCPIYNLSTEPVELACGDNLAMIDFVTTTKLVERRSIPFQWWHNKKLVFQQYSTDLRSGVEYRLEEIKNELGKTQETLTGELQKVSTSTSERVSQAQSRMDLRLDTFLTLVFTVVAILFAGLGVLATKGSDEPSFVSSPVWIAAVALYFALKPYAIVWSYERELSQSAAAMLRQEPDVEHLTLSLRPKFVELLCALLIIGGSLGFHLWHAHVAAKELADEKAATDKLASNITAEKSEFVLQIQKLRLDCDAKIALLQRQIDSSTKK